MEPKKSLINNTVRWALKASKPWQRGWRVALAAIALVASFYYAAQCVRRGNDFRTMWVAWNFVLQGSGLYQVVDYPAATPAHWRNPPFFTFATSPLGLFDIQTAGFIWFYFKLGLILWALLSLKRLSTVWIQRGWGCLWVPVVCTASWFNNDLTIGHMNLVTSILVIQGLLAYVERRNHAAALWSSLAVCVKGNAVILPIFYAAKREFRLAAMTVALCVVWTALPALAWGPSKTLHYNLEFLKKADFSVIYSDVDNGWAENWGLPELMMRMLGQAHPKNRYGRTLEWVRLSPRTATLIAQGTTAAAVLGLALWWWRSGAPVLHHAALAATATLVFSPVTRKAYLGTLLLPYFVLWVFLTSTPARRGKGTVTVLFALSLTLGMLIHTDLWGRPLAFFFEKWHALSFSLLLLLAAQILAALIAEEPLPASGQQSAFGTRREGGAG